MSLILDAPARKKSRRGNSPASLDAYRNQVEPRLRDRQAKFLAVLERYPAGKTAKEIAEIMGVELNTVSGRSSELRKLGLVEGTGVRREGSEVLRRVVRGQQSLFGGV